MRLLIIGEASGHVFSAVEMVQKRGIRITHCATIADALTFLREGKGADAALIDVREDIGSFIHQLAREHIHLTVVAYGTESDSQAAVRAIKAGAKEYLPLPPDEEMVAGILETLTQDNTEIIATAPSMKKILQIIDQIASAEASVLITGESGTGKEVIAKAIHKKSKRRDRDLVAVNCAAIPDQLLESELFGHEKGAFTGAIARRVGKFEEAHNSSLLLDEISEMELRLQAKLLRALQEREIVRVGGNQPVKLNIRFLATSNRDLRSYVQEGKFREDLYFRLQVIHLHLPPLRDRIEDIPLFAHAFAKKYAELNGLPSRTLTTAAMEKLIRYRWPGNVRELENTMHRAVLMAQGGKIETHDIFLLEDESLEEKTKHTPESSASTALDSTKNLVGRTMETVEKSLILDTLSYCAGNRTQAATMLGISIRTLRNKLSLYRVEEAA